MRERCVAAAGRASPPMRRRGRESVEIGVGLALVYTRTGNYAMSEGHLREDDASLFIGSAFIGEKISAEQFFDDGVLQE